MLDNSRIISGFDAELLLGRGWFLTAIQALVENGQLSLPFNATIDDVQIIEDPNWDMLIVTSLGVNANASLAIDNGQFVFTSNFNNTNFRIALPNFGSLAGEPVLKKVIGNADFENAIALLINVNLRASEQDEEPLPAGEHLERGNSDLAISFLPNGQDIALGIPRKAFFRFANDVWHTSLRDADGTHPLPGPGQEKQGDWDRVKTSVTQKRIKYTLEGEVPIDFWPDANVSLDLELRPQLVNGKLTFSVNTDLDVDTGFWGDLLAFTIGALFGFLLAIFTGGLLLVPGIAIGTVILLEVAEFVVGEVIERKLMAKDEQGNLLAEQSIRNDIIQFATPQAEGNGISIGAIDAIPSSIPVFRDTSNTLFNRLVSVTSNFDELELTGMGLCVAGKSDQSELVEPYLANITESTYDGDQLTELTYELQTSSEEETLSIDEVINRLSESELKPPVRAVAEVENPTFDIPNGRLCCPVLKPTHIRRENGVVTRIRFESGLELNTQDAVMLQDNAGIYLQGLQLIRPSNANPYFRSPPNTSPDDNFESLPEF